MDFFILYRLYTFFYYSIYGIFFYILDTYRICSNARETMAPSRVGNKVVMYLLLYPASISSRCLCLLKQIREVSVACAKTHVVHVTTTQKTLLDYLIIKSNERFGKFFPRFELKLLKEYSI